jgi:hypothetical protein
MTDWKRKLLAFLHNPLQEAEDPKTRGLKTASSHLAAEKGDNQNL